MSLLPSRGVGEDSWVNGMHMSRGGTHSKLLTQAIAKGVAQGINRDLVKQGKNEGLDMSEIVTVTNAQVR